MSWAEWKAAALNQLFLEFGSTGQPGRITADTIRHGEQAWMTRWNNRVFPAPTNSGHIEQSTLRKQHEKVCSAAGLNYFPFYTFRHTCLTKWSQHMDPYTLAYFAGHSDFATTRRYVHPNMESGRAAMERAGAAWGGHSSGHTPQSTNSAGSEREAVLQ
jgi:integrase